ncbi:MAG: RHS repeat-associated core domain-containing protein [Chloroflexota bacterium]
MQTNKYDEYDLPQIAGKTEAGVTPGNSLGYTGEQADPALGLINLRARMYDPNLGRFLQWDRRTGLIAAPNLLNLFAYVSSNPLTRSDPTGLAGVPRDSAPVTNRGKSLVLLPSPGQNERVRTCGLLEPYDDSLDQDAETGISGPIPSPRFGDIEYEGDMDGSAAGAIPRWRPGSGQPGSRGAGASITRASEWVKYTGSLGRIPRQRPTGPLQYYVQTGQLRLAIKQGSAGKRGSENPHIEIRDATGQRIDIAGNPVTRRSPGNHTRIERDLP